MYPFHEYGHEPTSGPLSLSLRLRPLSGRKLENMFGPGYIEWIDVTVPQVGEWKNMLKGCNIDPGQFGVVSSSPIETAPGKLDIHYQIQTELSVAEEVASRPTFQVVVNALNTVFKRFDEVLNDLSDGRWHVNDFPEVGALDDAIRAHVGQAPRSGVQ